jgi:predicted CXXCH cytochrome family protein
MIYPEHGAGLVPRDRLDPRLRLEGGRVGCLTCHGDPESPAALSISNYGSALCLSCHEK